MVDYLGDFRKSAQEALPVFLISGGAGMIYSATFDEAGRGSLRLAIADASKLTLEGAPPSSAAAIASAQSNSDTTPPPALAPVVSATQTQVWGAVSIANDAAGYSLWNYPSQQQAMEIAMQQCRSQSQYPDSCGVVVIADSQWAAGVWCNNGSMMRASWSGGSSAKEAISNAYRANLRDGSYVKDQCRLVNLIAGDGSHTRFEASQ